MCFVNTTVWQNNVVYAIIHTLLCHVAKIIERLFQALSTLCRLKSHGQFNGIKALIANVAKNVELTICQNRLWQTHHLAMALVWRKNIHAHSSHILSERHNQLLTNRVNSRIGNLGKLLTEVVKQQLRTVWQYSQRRVVTHRGNRLATIVSHRHNGAFHILARKTKHTQALVKIFYCIIHLTSTLQSVQLYAVCREPLAIRESRSKTVFQFTVIIYITLLRINQQNLAWLQTTFFFNFVCLETNYTSLRCYHHHVVLRNEIACRSKSITVEHTSCITSIAKEQGCGTIPRLHQNRMIFIEGFEILRDRILIIETFRHKHCHSMWQTQTRHYQKF